MATKSTGDLSKLCLSFANMLKESEHCVFYTGAGISTAASIPDFRSPTGLYEQFKNSGTIPPCVDITTVRPAFTHMAIKAMTDSNYIHHVISQNCDGLHLRTGMKSEKLSEIHGNMFIEMCLNCEPPTTFIRYFDTTTGTHFRRHKVSGAENRPCTKCGKFEDLNDSVVHCGEYARYEASPPYRWPEAAEAASKTDLIVCVGTSLQVLKCYATLWTGLKQKRGGRPRAKLVIINLLPTAKDKQADLIINHCCEKVLKEVCRILDVNVSDYDNSIDPIHLSSRLGVVADPTKRSPSPQSRGLIERNGQSSSAPLPGWLRATVDQLQRQRKKQQQSRRVGIFKSRRKRSK